MADRNLFKVPPHNEAAERAVVGAVICRPKNLDVVLQSLIFSDLYQARHQRILKAIHALSVEGREIDLITLADKLKTGGVLPEVGGVSYLAELFDEFISDANLQDHIRIVKEKSVLRSLITATSMITASCYDEHENVQQFVEKAEKMILEASQYRNEKTIVSLSEMTVEMGNQIEKSYDNRGKLSGVPSGFADLDKITNGFQKKDLIILAARPSVGKTAFCINVAQNCAEKNFSVGVFSLEMSTMQLAMRILSSKSAISSEKIRNGLLSERDIPHLANALGAISGLPIHIDDVSGQTLLELRSKARVMKREYNIDLLIIDYLQLMQSGEKVENRNLEIGQITRRLKLMAKELDIPIILLSQLNRQLEGRGDKRPGLADLRDSGSVEQDPDIVMFLYRESLYASTPENANTAELIIGKHRNGPVGTVHLFFDPSVTQFKNVAKKAEMEMPHANRDWQDAYDN